MVKNLLLALAIVGFQAHASYISGGGSGGGTGLLNLNGLTADPQSFATGTSGTDFGISSSVDTHTFNLPDASGSARGVITTGAQTIAGVKTFSSAPICSSLTATTVPYLNGSKALTSSAVTPTELGYLSGVTSAIQTQLGTKAPTASPTFTGTIGTALTASLPVFTDGSSNLTTNAKTGTGSVVMSASPTLTGTAVLASATVSGSLKSGNYHLEPCENDAGNSGTALTVDLSTCSSQKITLTGNVTLTLSNPVTGGAYLFKIATGAGSFSVTWPGTVKWAGGAGPTITTTASKVDLVNLYWDGTSYYGSFSQAY